MTLGHVAVEVATTLRVQWGSPLIQSGFCPPLVRLMSRDGMNKRKHRIRTEEWSDVREQGKKRGLEALWRDLFLNASQWCDHRPEKIDHRFPDFKHKQTGKALWLTDAGKPSWVQAELATIPPGTLQPDVFAWTQRLKKYVRAGQYIDTIKIFHQMQHERICPDTRTFLPILNACAGLGALEEGKRVHIEIIQRGCESDIFVANALVDMYAKCGSIEDAWIVFNKMPNHNVVSWTAMIGGYVKSGQGLKAMDLFRKMQQDGVEPNAVTFVAVLNACASIEALEEGRRVHEKIFESGYECNVYVANCLVDMYAKCGSIEDAWGVFNKMQGHNVVSWSAMIGGYVKSGQGLKAMELFWKMQQEGLEPNDVTFLGVLKACASVAALEEGKRVHEQIIRRGYESDVYIAACLVDMYARCGSIEDAWTVFNKMLERDVYSMASWNSMIRGYAMNGDAKKAIVLFKRMGKEGVEMNAITFTGLLSACSHGGLVKEGLRYFDFMTSCCNIFPTANHYACMVDLLGRAGRLEEAEEVAKRMPKERDAAALWTSLLGACRTHGNIEMAERVARHCCELDPENASVHVLLSDIYARA